ncbi:MAG: hypothetical protein KDA28_04540, partial [Phycisphaerales bacterium]|nr:hypothetical protein [Phycisphaerales bacterium]
MKVKGVNPIEAHVEKLVLAVVAVVLMAVLFMQFAMPSTIQVGGEDLSPERAFDPAKNEALAQQNRMEDQEPAFPEAPPATLGAQFDQVKGAALVPQDVRFAALGESPSVMPDDLQLNDALKDGSLVAPLVVPAPSAPLAAAYMTTVDPSEVIANPELAPLLPSSQPYDKTSVSVEATVDGTEIYRLLVSDPEGDAVPMPVAWWRDSFAILGIEVEREELTEDGEWTNLTPVEGIPGTPTLLADLLENKPTVGAMRSVIGEAQRSESMILEPDFVRTIAGPEWESPTDELKRQAMSLRQDEIDREIDRIKKLKRELDELQAMVDRLPKDDGDARSRNEPARDPRRDPGGMKGVDPGRQTTRERDTGSNLNPNVVRNRARATAQQFNKSVQSFFDEYGYDPLVEENSRDRRETSNRRDLTPLFERAEVKVHAHDFDVEPGKTYRYRLRLVVNNPAYGRVDYLEREQQELAEEALAYGAWTSFSAPIEVPEEQYYFVTGASPGNLASGPSATVEVYEFHYGYWRRGQARLEPGDMIETDLALSDPNTRPIWPEEFLRENQASNQRRPSGRDGGGRMIGSPYERPRTRTTNRNDRNEEAT